MKQTNKNTKQTKNQINDKRGSLKSQSSIGRDTRGYFSSGNTLNMCAHHGQDNT